MGVTCQKTKMTYTLNIRYHVQNKITWNGHQRSNLTSMRQLNNRGMAVPYKQAVHVYYCSMVI